MNKQPQNLPAEIYSRVFEGLPAGAEVLDELTRVFVRPPKRDGGIDAVLETYFRLGQRSVLDFILNRINAAQVGEANKDEGDDDGP